MINPRRGDVYLVSLDPTQGQEIKKVRPCAIVSPNELNDHLSTFMVAPMTTGGHAYPFRIPCRFQKKDGFIVLDQIRAVPGEACQEPGAPVPCDTGEGSRRTAGDVYTVAGLAHLPSRQLRLLAGHGLIIRAAGNAPRPGSETAIISTSRCPATAILAIAAQGAALPDKCMPPLIVPIQTEKIWNP